MSDSPPLTFEFTCNAAPVQAEGVAAGRAFYFRARGEKWEFTIAERPEDDPAALGPEDAASGRAWYRSGEVPGGRFAASYLPLGHARSLIHECARAYLDERTG
jgi:hypothetical protein